MFDLIFLRLLACVGAAAGRNRLTEREALPPSLPPSLLSVRTELRSAPLSCIIQTWRNSLPLSHLSHRPPLQRYRNHLYRNRCRYLRPRDDPGGWRSCRRACRRSLGAPWRCHWTRWSASTACPLWSAWPTVRHNRRPWVLKKFSPFANFKLTATFRRMFVELAIINNHKCDFAASKRGIKSY